MTSKTPKARHSRFLAAGFFPPEMPSCFYSETIAPHRDALLKSFAKIPPPKKSLNPAYYHYKSEKAGFNYPRFGREDRRHSYLNPISFFFLAKVLAENYVSLRKLNRQSRLSVAPSIFNWTGPRALIGPVFEPRDAQNSSLNARFELIAEADINGFYHSIYTHAIAWAIHGRDVAKARPKDYALCGNLIDLLVRNGQGGQTIGIPVGPDTSRLLAEVLGSAIDRTIQKSIKVKRGGSPNDRVAMRFVDDYTFGCESFPAAEKAIAAVRLAVNGYELELNNTKTRIRASAPFAAVAWREHIRSLIPSIGACDGAALNRYFYNVHAVASGNLNNDVIKYAIKAASRAFLDTDAWNIAQDYLLSAYRQSSTVITPMVETLVLRQMARRDVGVQVIGDFVNSRIPVLADRQKNGEIVWLLFLTIGLQLSLRASVAKRLSQIEDGAIAVLVSDAYRLGLVKGTLRFDLWNASLTQDGLRGPMWLYSYESTLKALNGVGSDTHVTGDAYFRELYTRKVEFYRSGPQHLSANAMLRAQRLENLRRKVIEAKLKSDLGEDVDDFWDDDEDVDDELEDVYD